ncbi:inorganic phosphate transporter [Bacteroidia bacterium]|nr:inorganic phosphate transporter [Bacteroidia bacterium]
MSKTVYAEFITLPIILSGLIAAIFWNLLTWRLGIPSSSSHTLIGGFAGAAICGAGFLSIQTSVILKIVAFIFLAPLIGMMISSAIAILVLWAFKKINPQKAENIFKKTQLVSSALFSVGHGLNDSQKVMGIIATAMIAFGMIESVNTVPTWVPLTCFAAIGLGTMMGGWRIVKTMGSKITKVTPMEGACADTAGAITLFITEILKIPVSTTHTITGAIIGVGAVKRLSAVRWGVTINLLWAWILTIPVSALLAAGVYLLVHLIGIR